MEQPYQGREQTQMKHRLLEGYLERVAYHIGWSRDDFVYVDGFSGPGSARTSGSKTARS